MVNNSLLSWPVQVTGLVTGINASLITLHSLLAVCQSEGIRRHNYGIITDLLPRLAEESETIYANARTIRADAPRRRGRPAKWVTVTEDVTALAIKLIDAANDIDEHIPANYWSTVAMLLAIMAHTVEQIEAEMGQISLDSVPEAFLEALDADL